MTTSVYPVLQEPSQALWLVVNVRSVQLESIQMSMLHFVRLVMRELLLMQALNHAMNVALDNSVVTVQKHVLVVHLVILVALPVLLIAQNVVLVKVLMLMANLLVLHAKLESTGVVMMHYVLIVKLIPTVRMMVL